MTFTIVTVAVIFMIIGSIYWLRPSPRETRLASLRFDAIRAGMQVREYTFKPDSAKNGVRDDIRATSYSYNKPSSGEADGQKSGALKYRVVRQAAWDSEWLPDGLYWHDKGSEQDAQQVQAFLSSLDDEVLMLEVHERRVTVMTTENQTASAQNYLESLRAVLALD